MSKEYSFKYSVGEKVLVSNPNDLCAWKNCVVDQKIKPFEYPVGAFGNNLFLFPTTRKKVRPTRYISYLISMGDKSDLYFWATENCLKKENL